MCANTTACCFSKCLYRGRSGSIEGLMDELECMCDSYTKVSESAYMVDDPIGAAAIHPHALRFVALLRAL
eukprot:COSAG05_NODE_6559_length_938_cov_1.592372_1_plen_70_part_00